MRCSFAFLVAVTLEWTATTSGLTTPVARCSPTDHICEGACPPLPPGVELPRGSADEGLCLKHRDTEACVCWLRNDPGRRHLQTLFKCEVAQNSTVKHVMCLPPPFCFSPDVALGCMIVRRCPCTPLLKIKYANGWHPVVAFILRSSTPVVPPAKEEGGGGGPEIEGTEGSREFSLKHLLFLLAFVIAPLFCWCLLTFFHGGRCRKGRARARRSNAPEAEPMRPSEGGQEEPRPEDAPPPLERRPSCDPQPSAPLKMMESPPPYTGQRCSISEADDALDDLGPPPTYEEAVRVAGLWWRPPMPYPQGGTNVPEEV